MRPVLVLRPEPGAAATAGAARARGLVPIVAPLFSVRALPWCPPVAPCDALLLTSAHAARLGGAGLDALRHLPVFAVGAATAAAARAAGFATVIAGQGDGDAIVARAAASGATALLHLCGAAHRAPAHPGVRIERRIVYAADALDTLPAAAVQALPRAVALLHSPRAAALFAQLAPARHAVAVAAISAAARAAAGEGWRAAAIADRPCDAALLAAAAGLCDG